MKETLHKRLQDRIDKMHERSQQLANQSKQYAEEGDLLKAAERSIMSKDYKFIAENLQDLLN